MLKSRPSIAIVTRESRLDQLVKRRSTRGFAKFAVARAREHELYRLAEEVGGMDQLEAHKSLALADAAASFEEYEEEASRYEGVISRLKRELDLGLPLTFVDRDLLANFDFGRCIAVVVAGQDGLVANTAKYVGDLPIIAVNPDPKRNDGILLPFTANEVRRAMQRVLDKKAQVRHITLAQAELSDGQRMLAFNDFFVGMRGHSSARYTLRVGVEAEPQSSSGVLVCTGAGSTGWMSSVFNMAGGVAKLTGNDPPQPVQMTWEERSLFWVVREPFKSRHSSTELTAGLLREGEQLVLESLMPEAGIIFSDGIEQDYAEFCSGTVARISVAPQRARLVVP